MKLNLNDILITMLVDVFRILAIGGALGLAIAAILTRI